METLIALQAGDHKAFERVFIAYFNQIKVFINKIIRSEDDAEELSQDLFVRLWTNHHTIDPQKRIGVLLYTMARNAAFNYLKHQAVHDSYVGNYTSQSTPDDAEEILFAKEIQLLAEMAVSRMPEQRKKIYRMSRNEGMTNDEIAQQLGITKKTVENQLSLALKELREIITTLLIFFL